MTTLNMFRLILFVVISMMGMPALADTIPLESITVMALGPTDGRAVIALPGGKMHVIKLGDKVPGTDASVVQILHDKLVMEEVVEKSGSQSVRQKVWLYKPKKPGEKSRIQRLDKIGPDRDPIQKPIQKQIQ